MKELILFFSNAIILIFYIIWYLTGIIPKIWEENWFKIFIPIILIINAYYFLYKATNKSLNYE